VVAHVDRGRIRRANLRVRELVEDFRLSDLLKSDEPILFLCECGCLRPVALTVAEFDSIDQPIYIAGHDGRTGAEIADTPLAADAFWFAALEQMSKPTDPRA
jgi:hypothetical protein